MLDELLNQTQRKIIDILLQRGDCSLSEITEEIDLSKPAVFRQVKELAAAGMLNEELQSTNKGRVAKYSLRHFSIFFSINPERSSVLRIETGSSFHPSHVLLEQVAQVEFKEELRSLVDTVDKIATDSGITAIILFGSVAEGEGTWKSDIDVAIVAAQWAKESKNRAGKIVSDACLGANHLIKPVYLSEERLESEDSVLVNEIRSSGMIIYAGRPGSDAAWRVMMRYKRISR